MKARSLSPRRLFRTRISEAFDKMFFIVIFAAGAATIWTTKSYEVDPLAIALFVVFLLLLYVSICAFTRIGRIREDVIGDNVYYLGFLFTLVSLGFALWQVRDVRDEELVRLLLSSFGIALLSTIAGIFLRVFVNQFRLDPVEVERDVRLELVDVATQLKSQLYATMNAFSDANTTIAQLVRESSHLSVTKHAELLKAMGEEVAVQIEEFAARLGTSLSKPLDDARRQLEADIGRLATTSRDLGTDLGSAAQDIKKQFRGIGQSIAKASERLESASIQYADRLSSTIKVMEEAVQQVSRDLEQLKTASHDQSEAFRTAHDRALSSIVAVEQRIVGTREEINVLSRRLTEIDTVRQHDASAPVPELPVSTTGSGEQRNADPQPQPRPFFNIFEWSRRK